jgi:hypothetical protein
MPTLNATEIEEIEHIFIDSDTRNAVIAKELENSDPEVSKIMARHTETVKQWHMDIIKKLRAQ